MLSALKAGVAYFLLIFAAGFLLGTVRVVLLVPGFGELTAVLIELPIMLAISWFACRWLVAHLAVPSTFIARPAMGASAFLLLMAAEAALALILFGQPPELFLAGFTHAVGLIGLAGQIAFALMPLLDASRRPR
jgi:hypothetical protein